MLSLLSLLLPGLLSPAFAAERASTIANYTTGTLAKPKIGLCPKECVDNPTQSACDAYEDVCTIKVEATVQGTPLEQLIDNGGTCGNCEPPPYLMALLGLKGNSRDYVVISTAAHVGKVKTGVSLVRPALITPQQRSNGTTPLWMAYRGDIDRDGDIDQFGGVVTLAPGLGIQAPLADLVISVPVTRGGTTRRDGGR